MAIEFAEFNNPNAQIIPPGGGRRKPKWRLTVPPCTWVEKKYRIEF